MTKALIQIASLTENKGLSYPPLKVVVNNDRAATAHGTTHRQPTSGSESQRYGCKFCPSLAHRTSLCPTFVTKSLPERNGMAYASRLCVWCLKGGHFKHECYSGKPCDEPSCQKDPKHHSSLCPVKERRGSYDHATAAPEQAAHFSGDSSSGYRSIGRGRGRFPRHEQS